MQFSEKQFNKKDTIDAFDEIYTNFDISTDEKNLADSGYPFDFPTRWLNDPSLNKRIAIRRLDVIPSSHSFEIGLSSWRFYNDELQDNIEMFEKIEITEYDNLIKVLGYLSKSLSPYDSEIETY